jgi:cobaltochelatase CobS
MSLTKHSERTIRRPCEQCGSKELYWAHDDAGKAGAHYCSEHSSANFTLINRDGTRHDCQGKYAATGEAESQESYVADPEPWMEPVWTPAAPPVPAPAAAAEMHRQHEVPQLPAAIPASNGQDDRMGALAALLDLLAPKADASQVHKIVDERLTGLVLPLKLEITREGVTKQVEGLVHKMLPVVITILSTGKHVMMVGPAGTGKSHIAGQAAEALGLASYSISLSPQTPMSALLGYMTATGEYIRPLFREAFEYGGVFHLDEVDNSHPSVLAVTNAALANGHMAFPDGMVKRSPDFRCVASANTYGTGPDRSYVGRQAIDAATKDRFEIVDVPVDEALEESLCMATGLDGTSVRKVLAYVRHLRAAADGHKLPLSFSPRRSEAACTLLKAGLAAGDVKGISVRRGISDADWQKVSQGAPSMQ